MLTESFRFAWQALNANRLRSTLSLLGISIGIFSVITVFTIVDSWEYKLKKSFDKFGSEILYVQKWPMEFRDDYPWWKYISRPLPSLREFSRLQDRLNSAEAICFQARSTAPKVRFLDRSASNISVSGVSTGYEKMRDFEISQGRYPTATELRNGSRVCVIGSQLGEELFGSINPIGKEITALNSKFRVVGVFAKEGDNVIDNSFDNQVLIPVSLLQKLVNLDDMNSDQFIMVKAKGGVPFEEMKYDVKGAMRGLRKIRPGSDDNFALNNISLITNFLSGFFTQLWIIGLLVGGFSLLVGGVGVANIMFVSVWERTGQIGIQKALGARRAFILWQFLFESILQSLVGGIIGLIMVLGVIGIINAVSDWGIFLSSKNIIITVIISASIGLISGLVPALRASSMNPVDAIRSNN